MDLINVTNGKQIYEFYKKVKGKIWIFQAAILKCGYVLEIGMLATNAKFQLNISIIMPARPKKHRNMGCEYHYCM